MMTIRQDGGRVAAAWNQRQPARRMPLGKGTVRGFAPPGA